MVVNTWLKSGSPPVRLTSCSWIPETFTDDLVESGLREAIAGMPTEPDGSLAALRFADLLRRSADRLCHRSAEAARQHGASWREFGAAVGGITRKEPNIVSVRPPRSVDQRRRRSCGQERNAGRFQVIGHRPD